MGIFSKIKDAIFGHKATADVNSTTVPSGWEAGTAADATAATTTTATEISQVDVAANLRDMAAAKGMSDLNYNGSIVDLMKVLDLDSSLDNRKELADELGYTGAKDGSAEMNTWLHKEVMRQLAANGGMVPASMTD